MAIVLMVVSLFFGFYVVAGGSVILNEASNAVSYFEPTTAEISGSSLFAYYLFSWWSPSYGNPQQSMINAIYAAGLGFILQGIADLIGVTLGYQPIAGAQLVAFVAGAFVAIYYAYSFYQIGASAAGAAITAGAGASEVAAIVGAYGLLAAIITYINIYISVLGAL